MLFRRLMMCGALLVAVGCGGGDDGDPPEVQATVPATVDPGATTTEATTATGATEATTTTLAATTTTVAEVAVPQLTFSDPPTEAELFALADAYWSVFDAASRVPDPNYPGLEEVIGEPLLTRTRENLSGLLERGEYAVNPTHPHVYRLLFIDGDSAATEECYLDDGRILDSATGGVVNDRVVRVTVQLEMARESGQWRVVEHFGRDEVENGQCA